ncbi:MarR family transcriptional regulator [Macellibacteroides sp. HH-ZS]|nr:MarR family transcriptional regulator [Macellibacteroides sp. HH-ZS]
MAFEQLKLENQVCFPLYAASRLVIQAYQEDLSRLNITYPQYLVMLVLWEKEGIAVNEISDKLILNTNTITPLLKRMEGQGLIERRRSLEDERKVIVNLTQKGKEMETEAVLIPYNMLTRLKEKGADINLDALCEMKSQLDQLIRHLT